MSTLVIRPNVSKGIINRNIYGHFSEHLGRCVYQGMFVGKDSPIPNENGMRTDVVDALRKIQVPVLRWPGGCFADEYHWRDGVGTQETRKRMVNTHWGGVVEDNSFGTHEFMELCRQIGCEPYVNGNVGSGTIREMSEWVEYLNSDGDSTIVRERRANGRRDPYGVKYWGVGNENWGCGGNMRPEYYADLFRQFQTYCRDYGENKLTRIACGPSADDYNWTDVLMKQAGRFMNALTLHYYTVVGSWENKGWATEADEATYNLTLAKASFMDELIVKHRAIMDQYDPDRRIGLIVDEWGCWHNVERGTVPGFLYQQNTMRDAVVAALTLNIFNRHCDRVVMANLAQTVNVLQSVLLTDGADMLLTPTYHVFDLYKAHQDATEAACDVSSGVLSNGLRRISASASVKDGVLTATAANLSMTEREEIRISIVGFDGIEGFTAKSATGRVITGGINAHNTFEDKNAVEPKELTVSINNDNTLSVTMPPCSVAALTING
ncbi:MAG: alpha-N-arabinofuranosidase [Oscillospiraceae bacterium]|jgi:alpha-N-arabinofuranosidase|nr:alpha-N-arabinofuranosidase [Oscillospiraceae bacterium]